MSTNPFASPSEYASSMPPPPMGEDGWVKQLPFLGVFMLIEGAMELLYGGFMTTFSFVIPIIMANDPNFQRQMEGDPNMPFRPEQFVFWIYFVLGFGPLIAGIARIIGGIFVLRRTGRTFAIAANVIGFACAFGCYCIPTGFATSIYGLVLLLQTPVANAFAQKAAEKNTFKPPY
jgi:hypothetical protein